MEHVTWGGIWVKDFTSFITSKAVTKVYPDIAVWRRFPLNRIPERLTEKGMSKPEKALEEACLEELSDYLRMV
jgi:hypothetical protein